MSFLCFFTVRIQLFARGSLGARCAYFPIIGKGEPSRKRSDLGPLCRTDHGRVKVCFTLLIMDFDLYKMAGQSRYQRCHWMTSCASLIVLAGVLNVTVT